MTAFRLFGCPACSHTFVSEDDAQLCPLCHSPALVFGHEVPGPVASGSTDAPAGDSDPNAEPEIYVFGVICPHCERGVEIELTDNMIEARIPAGAVTLGHHDTADDAPPTSSPPAAAAEPAAEPAATV